MNIKHSTECVKETTIRQKGRKQHKATKGSSTARKSRTRKRDLADSLAKCVLFHRKWTHTQIKNI